MYFHESRHICCMYKHMYMHTYGPHAVCNVCNVCTHMHRLTCTMCLCMHVALAQILCV